jgi:hypothetical protein
MSKYQDQLLAAGRIVQYILLSRDKGETCFSKYDIEEFVGCRTKAEFGRAFSSALAELRKIHKIDVGPKGGLDSGTGIYEFKNKKQSVARGLRQRKVATRKVQSVIHILETAESRHADEIVSRLIEDLERNARKVDIMARPSLASKN